MKYKVGDKVRIKSLDWYNENKDDDGIVELSTHVFIPEMIEHCGQIVTIKDVFEDIDDNVVYYMEEIVWDWTDEMIEGLVERNGKIYPYKIGDRVILKGKNRCATITDLKYNSHGNLSYYIKIDNDKDISIDYPTDLLLPYDNKIEGLVEEETKPKFKVGDSVEVLKSGNVYTISQMKFNGKEFVYTLSNNGSTVSCFSENELKPIRIINMAIKPHNVRGDKVIKMLEELGGTNVFSFDGSDHNCVNPFAYYIDKDKQIYGGGIEFLRRNGYEIHALEELKKKEYPKTYEECCKILGVSEFEYNHTGTKVWYRHRLMATLDNLMLCRDAYWKIAGEEMGLGKPWKPDFTNDDEERYGIYTAANKVVKDFCGVGDVNIVLTFPTEEMRDAFYENFKELIEECKELL